MKEYKEYAVTPDIDVVEHQTENENGDRYYSVLAYSVAIFEICISKDPRHGNIETPTLNLHGEDDIKMFDEGMDVARKIFRNGGMTWLQTTK